MRNLFKPLATLLVLVLLLIGFTSGYPSMLLAAPIASLNWAGNLVPKGNSNTSITNGQPFNVYLQVYKAGVTNRPGRGDKISCMLHWGEVDSFGGAWRYPVDTPMTYNGDIGDNDEYKASIVPGVGLYEFTASCTDPNSAVTLWQSAGNGRLTVNTAPADRRALWITKDIIAWNSSGAAAYELHYDTDGLLNVPVNSGSGIPLSYEGSLSGATDAKFPNINGYDALRVPESVHSQIPAMLKGEMAIAAYDGSGNLIDATGIQIQGVLDDLYSYSGDLGVLYTEGIPTLKLWAPTAQSVTLHRFANPRPTTPAETSPMTFDPETGVWSILGEPSWDKQYYLYEVEVYVPLTGQIEKNLVTDPYSVNLSQNSQRSQIVDLYEDPTLKPEGWDSLVKPTFTTPEDMAIYEVHVRDFSRDDQAIALEHQGTFKAFTYDGQNGRPALSAGMAHLIHLAKAGLTHIHIMPAFDFASVNEDPGARLDPDYATLGSFAPDSDRQQAIIAASRGLDSFNWGYDPYHYGVPEGSYATGQNDTSRILEFREMVQALSENNLRLILGVVYNHTSASGLYNDSVLDKIVPGYYYRYTNNGYLYTSSCCSDTAVEFDMMRKLMVDTLVRWAKAYKVDGFRFDLMNLHTVDSMLAVRDALQALTLENDGVDGQTIYLYGEGWDFGSAAARGLKYAKQYNMAGTNIGTFNDKIRDAIHGGSSGDSTGSRRQGFINGQAYDWNGHFYSERFLRDLRYSADRLRIALAGSLQNFQIIDQNNNRITGSSLNGSGYTTDPQESVNYISKHDNETLYDLNMLKMPIGENDMARTSMAERLRSQNLGVSLVGLSQGIPFFQMGVDMLRSKSLDRNSYDSGDWFNRVDFTYNSNNFGVGLPPAWDNHSRWPIMAPLLANPALGPSHGDILSSVAHMQEILKIRKSSKLFRLETGTEIQERVRFHNTGSKQKDALIVMSISDTVGTDLDPDYESIVVLFNADKKSQTFTMPELVGTSMSLHPIQANSHDPLVKEARFDRAKGEFAVPARTTAVFVSTQAPMNGQA